jgi:diguanylate cyclase (GGDEF)-like protein
VCDLDYFKVVNDGLGHAAGDEVLIEVARRISGCVRPSDLVARLGGDEFVIVTDGGEDHIEVLAQRVIDTIAVPMTLSDGTRLTPSVSVGVAHAGPGFDQSTLLRDADAALFRAKDLGRGRLHRFDDELRLQVVDRLLIQTEVPDALAHGDLYCVYQPEIVIATGELFSFEALSRWDHPTRGAISPDRFIPVIEDIGASRELFDHVLEQTLDAQSQWAKRLGFHPSVAINLSARQLGDTDLPRAVARALTRTGCPADSLWIEVTESALAGDTASDILRALHDLGVRLAIDDFGTGWSSMARLATFPWDLLKIDQSFVHALGGTTQYAEQVVSSTIALAHALGIRTTAEGVETAEQLDRLADLGCDVAQGYLFARPQRARDAITHITADGRWIGPGFRAADAASPRTMV